MSTAGLPDYVRPLDCFASTALPEEGTQELRGRTLSPVSTYIFPALSDLCQHLSQLPVKTRGWGWSLPTRSF